MPFVRRDVLDALLRDDAEWMRLLREAKVEGAREAAEPRDRLIANQSKLIEDQAELIDFLKTPPRIVTRAEGESTPKLGLGDLRGSGQVVSEPGGMLFNQEDQE